MNKVYQNSKKNTNKYGVRTDDKGKQDRTADGILFDSKKECIRYQELRLLEKAGQIVDLRLQPKFQVIIHAKNICTYIADFDYMDVLTATRVIEDVKGMKTPVYRLKKKLVEALHFVTITEV